MYNNFPALKLFPRENGERELCALHDSYPFLILHRLADVTTRDHNNVRILHIGCATHKVTTK